MHIRNLRQEDFFTLQDLDWSPLVKERDSIYLVIAIDQCPTSFVAETGAGSWMGVLLASRSADGKACFINHLLVLPQYRGQGVGSGLVKRLKGTCRDCGIRRVWFFTTEENRRFYERLGFSEDAGFLAPPIREYVRETKHCLTMQAET